MPFDNITAKHFDSGDYPECLRRAAAALDLDAVRGLTRAAAQPARSDELLEARQVPRQALAESLGRIAHVGCVEQRVERAAQPAARGDVGLAPRARAAPAALHRRRPGSAGTGGAAAPGRSDRVPVRHRADGSLVRGGPGDGRRRRLARRHTPPERRGRPGDTDVSTQIAGLNINSFSTWAGLAGKVPRIAVNNGYCFAGNAA